MLGRVLKSAGVGVVVSVIAGVLLVGFWILRATIALHQIRPHDPNVGVVVGIVPEAWIWYLLCVMFLGFVVGFGLLWRRKAHS